jgi:hypothetical protein
MAYVVKPRAGAIYDDDGAHTVTTIVEATDEPQQTGLLNAQGEPLFRVKDRHPFGFDLSPRSR